MRASSSRTTISGSFQQQDTAPCQTTPILLKTHQKELPEEIDLNESELPPPAEQARHIATRLETRAGALRNASREVSDQPGLLDD